MCESVEAKIKKVNEYSRFVVDKAKENVTTIQQTTAAQVRIH